MTDQEMRIAIAESLGWKWYRRRAIGLWADRPMRSLYHPVLHAEYVSTLQLADMTERQCNAVFIWREGMIPDSNDLNAMCEALVVLLKKRNLRAFCNAGQNGAWECVITENETPNAIPCDGDHYGAGETLVAAMREAYLRAVGKWKD